MADNEVTIQLIAKVDSLQSGLTEAVNAMRSAVDKMGGDLHKLEGTAEESESTLKKILSGESFIVMKEKAEMAFEAIKEGLELLKEGFESTVGKAEEFGLENAKFAAMMGTSETEAAGLSAALRGVGSSAQEFESMALRMQMRVNANESAFEQMGVKTRDASGALLSGKDLMDSAISTMREYKGGSDQNAFALEVFGRRAADVYNIMRVGDEDVSRQIEIYRSMGVELEGAGEQSEQLESVTNDLRTTFDALSIKIGQDLMPVAREFIDWLAKDGRQTFRAIADLVVELVKDMASLLEILGDVYDGFVSVGKGLAATGAADQGFDASELQTAADTAQALGKQADGATSKVSGLRQALNDLAESVKKGLSESDEANKPFRMFDEGGIPASLERPTTNPFAPEGGARRFTPPKKGKSDKSGVRAEDEEIKDAEKLSLSRLAIEESTNQHVLAMGQETDAAYISQKTAIENEAYAIKLDGLNKELDIQGRTKAQRQKTLDELKALEVTHQGVLLKIQQEAETQRAALDKQTLADFMASDDERLKVGTARIQELAKAGQIGADQEATQELELTQVVRREELARLDAHIAGLTAGTKAYEQAIKERAKLETQLTLETEKIQDAHRAKVQAQVTQWTTAMATPFKTAINDMMLSGKNFQTAMADLAKGVESGFINMIENIGEKWIEQTITDAVMATTTTQASAVAQISANAGVAASGAAASQAGIPIVGPALAVGAAAAMLALVLGYESLAHAEGGMVLDRNQLVFAHKNEMILPAHLSQGVQQMISSGGAGGGQGDVNLTYAPTMHGAEPKGLAQMLRDDSGAMVAFFHQMRRDGRI
jgi:hypothetical protein